MKTKSPKCEVRSPESAVRSLVLIALVPLLAVLWVLPARAVEGESVNVLTPVEIRARQVFSALIDHDQIDPYYLADMEDVDLTGLADTDLLGYDLGTDTWVPVEYPTGATNYWQRTGTILSPATANDSVYITGEDDNTLLYVQNDTGSWGIYGSGMAASSTGVVGETQGEGGTGVAGFYATGTGTGYGVVGATNVAANDSYGGKFDHALIEDYADFAEQASPPADPDTGLGRLYAANDGTLHYVDDGSTDYDLTSTAAHALLSTEHSDTSPASPTRGDLITAQGASPKWSALAAGSPGNVLTMGATEPGWSAPAANLAGEPFVTTAASANLSAESVLSAGAGITILPGAGTVAVVSNAPWTLVARTGDATLGNDTTINNDDTLSFSYASGYYAYSIRVYYTTTAAGDFKFANAWSANLSRTNYCYSHVIPGTAAGTAALFSGVLVASGTEITMAGTGTTGGYIQIDGAFQASGAGTFNFQWSKASADAGTTTVHAGSYLQYRKVS